MLVCTECKAVVGEEAQACPGDGAKLESMERLPEGAVLGDYHVVKMLGEGGMGFVYEANHQVLGRRCALKILRPEFAADETVVTRFLLEAKAVNVINHKHIVNVYDYGDGIDGLVYFVMEYLEGEALTDLLKRIKPMPPVLLVHVFTQVLQGLAAAHAKKIIHRDLKPDNVFIISRMGNPLFAKLLDFGVAKLRGEEKVDGLTSQGALIGTPEFMSPEQFQGEAVDTRSDVFSLGNMLYAAATGTAPFPGTSLGELAARIIMHDPAPITELVPEFPIALQEVIDRALQKDPAERYANAQEMLEALGPVVQQIDPDRALVTALLRTEAGDPDADIEPASDPSWSLPATDTATKSPSRKAARKRPHKAGAPRRGMAMAGAAVAVAALGLGVLLLDGDGDAAVEESPSTGSADTEAGETPAGTTLVASAEAGERGALRAQAAAEMSSLWTASDASTRARLVEALAKVGAAASEPVLRQALAEDPQTLVRAARALAELKTPTAGAAVFAALDKVGAKLKIDLVASLLAMGDERAHRLLEQALAQPRSQFVAALALVKQGADRSEKTLQRVRDVFEETPEWKGHWLAAAEALLATGDQSATEALSKALSGDASPAHQVAAAALLATQGSEAGQEHLSAVVADARSKVRDAAALALARLGHEDALLFVPVGMMSDDVDAQVTAIAILSRVGGEDLEKQSKRLAATATSASDPAVKMAALAALAGLGD